MKVSRLLPLAVLALVLPAYAGSSDDQNSPLVLRGKLSSLELKSNESWGLKFQAQFELQITNISNDKVILRRRDPIYVPYSSPNWTDDGEVIFEASERSPLFDVPRSAIDKPVPPGDWMITLGPHETYTTHTSVPLEFYPPRPGHANEQFYPHSKRAKLMLTLDDNLSVVDDLRRRRLSDDDSDSDDDEFNSDEMPEVLQERWAAQGKLYLEKIESEPIEIPLPPPPDLPEHSGLALRGHMAAVKIGQTPEGIHFTIEVDLSFVNTGKRPVILLRPNAPERFGGGDLWWNVWGIGADQEAVEKGRYWRDEQSRPSNSRSFDMWKFLREALDQPYPPIDFVWVISPGDSTPPHRTTIQFFSSELPASNLWLQMTLPVWPFNIEPTDDNEFGQKLRQQWIANGVLELGQDCDFKSKPIELVLPHRYKQE